MVTVTIKLHLIILNQLNVKFLNYQKEELLNAKKCPEEHKNLRVRVSGFSDYFVSLNGNMQDEIIERTSHKN